MKGERVKSRFVAAEVARDVRHGRARWNAGLEGLEHGTSVLLRRVTDDVLHATECSMTSQQLFVRASIDEVVGVLPQDGLLEKGERFLLLKAHYGTRLVSRRWQRHYMTVLRMIDSEQSDAWFLSSPRTCGNVPMPRRRFHG